MSPDPSPDTLARHAGELTPPPPEAPPLPPQALCEQVLQQRYLQPGERHREDLFSRVALALAQAETVALRSPWATRFRQTLQRGGLLSGRILVGAGTGLHTTLANGFVQPVGDCTLGRDDAGQPGIYDALGETAETLRRGGAVGCDFSPLRPLGALVRSTASLASGPCSYIDVFERSCATLAQASVRPSVQQALLRIDHPDILQFIAGARAAQRWPHFRLQVGVTDAFMQALAQDQPWPLVHRAAPGQALIEQGAHWRGDGLWVYRTLPARALWAALQQAARDSAEPGLLFLDTVQRDNNLRSIETLHAASPGGAPALPPYGSTVQAALVLPRFVRQAFGPQAQLDFAGLDDCAGVLVRALDNALDLGWWPLPAQQREARTKRRIGLGLTGLADALAMLGLRYDSEAGQAMAVRIARCLRDAAYRTSSALAREKGPYPLFNAEACLADGTCASRLPSALQAEVRAHGLRNSHLLCLAPMGGVDLALADHTSGGIGPALAWRMQQPLPQLPQLQAQACALENHAYRQWLAQGGDPLHLPEAMLSAAQLTPQAQLAMVAALQPLADGGIVQPLHLPASADAPDWGALCSQAWRLGLHSLLPWRADSAPPDQPPEAAATPAGA